jgi:hypothetical protein
MLHGYVRNEQVEIKRLVTRISSNLIAFIAVSVVLKIGDETSIEVVRVSGLQSGHATLEESMSKGHSVTTGGDVFDLP